MEYKRGQPFNDNMLQPCPLLDNPDRLVEVVEKSGTHSIDLQNPENVRNLCDKCRETSERWKPTADKLWETRMCEKIHSEKQSEKVTD
ncbi:hypothetical protein LJC25_02225 [Bacteroidales bacterium OttesenSCG-928-K03]|nr:hypothetical protein [Bacteroidales bacterium OttesenSCG-928-K03]